MLLATTTTTTLKPNTHAPNSISSCECLNVESVEGTILAAHNVNLQNANVAPTASSVCPKIVTTKTQTKQEQVKSLKSPIKKPRIQAPLASCLKRSSSSTSKFSYLHGSAGKRLIRGLWNPSCASLFAHVYNHTIVNCMSFLDIRDLLAASQVCTRWKHCAQDETLWRHVDATMFAQATYQQMSKNSNIKDPRQATSQALHDSLQPHVNTMKSLKIHSIQDCLDANVFLPSISTSLQSLTMTGYTNLSDTHVQVMLVSASTNKLQKLVLDNCPLLSNNALLSISRHCTNLHELSLQGCIKITSVESLQPLWATRLMYSPTITMTTLQSMFASPPSAAIASRTTRGGKLCRVNLCRTSVTAASLVTALQAVPGKVGLQQVYLDGEAWNDALLKEFATIVGLDCLEI